MHRKFAVTSVVKIYSKCENYACIRTIMILFYQLPNKANSSHKPTFCLGISPFLLSHTVVWAEISEKKQNKKKHQFF